MEIEGCQELDLELEDHDLIDNYQFPETVDAKNVVDSRHMDDQLPELCESTEPERNQRNGRYNLRKSLAWDSAFFTSAGVLDAEELSSMITGSDKKKKHILPGIQEEISGSTESISTLQSDSLTLESLDEDLFLDIRASIQRSTKKASNPSYLSCKIAAMELADGSAISSPKKEDFVSKNKSPKPGVKKTSSLQTVRMSKSQLKPIGKSSGRTIKQDSFQSQIGSIHKTGEKNSILPRPLKTISGSLPSTTATKRDSVGTDRAKPECGSSKQGPITCKGTQLAKVSAPGGSRKVLPKPVVSLKSTSSSTTSSVHSARSSISSDNSINISPRNATKPTVMTARRNPAKYSNVSSGSSGSVPKNPSRAVPKNKLPASTLSSYLKSTKIPTTVSPASSVSEWSSASSTSSVVNQRSNNLRTSLDTSSRRSVDGDKIHLDPKINLAGQKAERQGNQGVILTSSTSNKSSTESGTLRAPAKPSGLRLPSPKIGFFDGSSTRTPNGQQRSQSSLHPGLPKNGTATSTPTRSSNGKLKSAKVPTARMASSSASIKSISPKAASPASSQEKLHALADTHTVLMDVNGFSSLSCGVKSSGTGESCQKSVEVEAEDDDKLVVNEGADTVDKDNLGGLSLNKNMSTGDVETAAGEGNYTSGSEYISQTSTPTQSSQGKLKIAEVPSARMDTSLANIKSGSPKAASPASSQEKSHALVKASSISVNVDYLSISSLGVKGNDTGETCQRAVEVPAGNSDKEGVDAETGVIDKDNFCNLSLKESINSGDTETPSGEGSYSSGSEYISQIGDDMLINNNSIPSSEAIEKENESNCQLRSDKSECMLSSTTAALEAAACIPPSALTNLSCSSHYSDNPTELAIQAAGTGVVGKDNSCNLSLNKNVNSGDIEIAAGEGSYTSGSEYISRIGDNILINKNSGPTSEAVEKENDPANCQGQGLPREKKGIYQKNHELNCQLLSDTLECGIFSTAAACRPPFALKNNCSNECFDNPSELVVHVAVAGNTVSLDEKENS